LARRNQKEEVNELFLVVMIFWS